MDIPDFELVVQWRASELSMCSLMQRLGRASRDPSLQGTFVLFAESKYFDKNKKPADNNTQHQTGRTPHSRPSNSTNVDPSDATSTGNSNNLTSPSINPRSIDEVKAERKANYLDYYRADHSLKKGKSKSAEDREPPLDDFINASERGLHCRRVPGDLLFENDGLRECLNQFHSYIQC